MKKLKENLPVIFVVTVIVVILLLVFTPAGTTLINKWEHALKKADDASNYDTLKEVEVKCRSMISSYKADILIYEQYKDSESEEERSWGQQAKIRANRTAVIYNEYILKNSYVWKDNIPSDVKGSLEVVE